ncbi:MAG: hypothetical protein RL174_5 [Actinomycetota bacterium]|jgi:hypothetical protein
MQSENNNPYQIDDVKPKSLNAKFAAGAVTFSIGAIALSQLFNPALAQALVGTFGQPVQAEAQSTSAESNQITQGQPSSTGTSTSTAPAVEFNATPISEIGSNSANHVLVTESLSAQTPSALAESIALATPGVAAPKAAPKPFLNSIALPTASDQAAANLSSATPYGSSTNGGSQAGGNSASGGKTSGGSNSQFTRSHESESEHFSKASEKHERESNDHDDEGDDD